MMKRIMIILTVALFPLLMEAQKLPNRFIQPGLLTGKGTLAFGKPLAYSGTNMYVSGNVEYYLEHDLSIRSGVWLFLGTTGDNDVLQKNHTLFTGFNYHVPTNGNFDPYLSFEPGVNWTQLKVPDDPSAEDFPYNVSKYKQSASPVVALGTGVNYFAGNVIHLFIEGKYLYGIHVSDVQAVSLSEFRFAFGFGWNMWLLRKHNIVLPEL